MATTVFRSVGALDYPVLPEVLGTNRVLLAGEYHTDVFMAHCVLANLRALKRAGVAHLFVERRPSTLQGVGPDHPHSLVTLSELMRIYSPYVHLVAAACAIGMQVHGMDPRPRGYQTAADRSDKPAIDRGMASNIAAVLSEAGPTEKAVVVAGGAHVSGGIAIGHPNSTSLGLGSCLSALGVSSASIAQLGGSVEAWQLPEGGTLPYSPEALKRWVSVVEEAELVDMAQRPFVATSGDISLYVLPRSTVAPRDGIAVHSFEMTDDVRQAVMWLSEQGTADAAAAMATHHLYMAQNRQAAEWLQVAAGRTDHRAPYLTQAALQYVLAGDTTTAEQIYETAAEGGDRGAQLARAAYKWSQGHAPLRARRAAGSQTFGSSVSRDRSAPPGVLGAQPNVRRPGEPPTGR